MAAVGGHRGGYLLRLDGLDRAEPAVVRRSKAVLPALCPFAQRRGEHERTADDHDANVGASTGPDAEEGDEAVGADQGRVRDGVLLYEAKEAKAAAKEAKAAAKGTVADQGVQQQKVGGGKWILRMLAYFWIGIVCAGALSTFSDGGNDFFATIMAGGILAIPGILILKFVK